MHNEILNTTRIIIIINQVLQNYHPREYYKYFEHNK